MTDIHLISRHRPSLGRAARGLALLGAAGLGVAAAALLTAHGVQAAMVGGAVAGLAAASVGCVALFLAAGKPGEMLRLALTDPLTGLGNTRHFLERLERCLDRADATGGAVTVVLLDVDDFKTVNDRYGHPAGDAVLMAVASCMRAGGEGFRLGGDEFALLLPGRMEARGVAVAESVLARIASAEHGHGGRVTVSAGVATYPGHGIERAELVRAADEGLYRAKRSGKNCVHVHPFDAGEASPGSTTAEGRGLFADPAGAPASAGLRRGRGGLEIGDIASRIARRMGMPVEHVELIRLAGDVTDLGKLNLPDELLRKAGPLSDEERLELERHPQIAHEILDSLGADPLATWVLHHHERWDGAGYPARLSGQQIPLAARILFVADALDAMTSDQSWRPRMGVDEALCELARCAGTQFDPEVVRVAIQEFTTGAATASLGAVPAA